MSQRGAEGEPKVRIKLERKYDYMELQLVFRCTNGKKRILIVNDPREDVTLEEATNVMQLIIDKNVFDSANGDLVEIVEARMHTCEYVVLL